MQLKTYLEKHSISVAEFARVIGAKSRATVYRYIEDNEDNKRTPDANMMQKIASATQGLVTANDFYDLQVKPKNRRTK